MSFRFTFLCLYPIVLNSANCLRFDSVSAKSDECDAVIQNPFNNQFTQSRFDAYFVLCVPHCLFGSTPFEQMHTLFFSSSPTSEGLLKANDVANNIHTRVGTSLLCTWEGKDGMRNVCLRYVAIYDIEIMMLLLTIAA